MSREHGTVSIIMPAFNAEKTIGGAIESVLAQGYRHWELVICDDASADATADIVMAFADSRIRLLRNPHNVGPGRSRDAAIEAATGSWGTFLDADDAWLPGRLERLLEVARSHPEAIVCDELLECHDTPAGLVPWRTVRPAGYFETPATPAGPRELDFADFIRSRRTIMQPLIPMNVIRQHAVLHGGAPYSEDLAFVLQLAACGTRLVYVPEAMYLYRLTRGSASTHSRRHQFLQQTLEDALPLFAADPASVAAIEDKLADIRYHAQCHRFFLAVKSGKIGDALAVVRHEPKVLIGFVVRVLERIPYHLHRALHRGSGRGTP